MFGKYDLEKGIKKSEELFLRLDRLLNFFCLFENKVFFIELNIFNFELLFSLGGRKGENFGVDFKEFNLKFIIKELREKYQITSANRLVLQILFIRYLIDRGISIGYEGFKNDAIMLWKYSLLQTNGKNGIFCCFNIIFNVPFTFQFIIV